MKCHRVAFDPEEPSLGRIRADSIAPPHNPTSIKRCISRVERNPAFAYTADIFADITCETPLKESHISFLRTDGPGLSPNEPMAILLTIPIPGPDGRYVIKNRTANIFWHAGTRNQPITTVFLYPNTVAGANAYSFLQVNEHCPIIFKCLEDNLLS
jgi:hypothetical protein